MNAQAHTGILLVNLGTPDSPHPSDVHRYLVEFLTDPRVIDTPWLSRQLLVRGVIIPKRYRESAKAYKEIWTSEGSPLKVYGHRVEKALQQSLGSQYRVMLAMRYQNPSIKSALDQFKQLPLRKLIVLPLFPQYASATTGSVHESIMKEISNWQVIPEMRFIDQYATHPGMIKAFCNKAAPFDLKSYDHVLFSFHGLPVRQLVKADPSGHCFKDAKCCGQITNVNQQCYAAQCHSTANAIIESLGLSANYSISYQSRLGKEPWLEPFTIDTIRKLSKEGKRRILVFCPAFVSDCLETIYEIGIEYAHEFKKAGGESLDLVPGLNDSPIWIEALHDIVKERI